jgi:pimeloyl-ACP methyl ester carboxylesterase
MARELLDNTDLELERAQAALLERCAPDASVRRIRWRGGETQVVELGEGPTVVLVHGGGDAGFNWYPVLGALAEERRVVVVDRPGHGLAEAFDYRGVGILEHATAFLTDVLDALGVERAELAGCSIGGLWSAAFALEAPDRVERLSLVGSPPGLTRSAPKMLGLAFGLPLVGRLVGRRLLANPTRDGSRAFWGRLLVAHPERLADDFLDVDVAHMRRNRDSIVSLMCEVATLTGVRKDLVLGERWRGLAIPTLALFGDDDVFLAPDGWRAWQALAAESPFVELVRVPRAGHIPWLDEPERVVGELDRFHARASLPERSTT